jgi:hypothetical protein
LNTDVGVGVGVGVFDVVVGDSKAVSEGDSEGVNKGSNFRLSKPIQLQPKSNY